MKPRKAQRYERYEFQDSPWVQNLTQRDLAHLLGKSKDQLEALIRDKEKWVGRRDELIAGKQRKLAVPYGKLRTVHERLKFHLNKIKQPNYLFSPRKGKGQRDNAEHHVGQNHFLSLDIRQFYPSTLSEHIFRWAHHVAGLRTDVAGLLVHLVSVDGKMPFGSPISPILTTHVHRVMFDAIYEICLAHDLKMSLWVDDLTISGARIDGRLIEEIRSVIRQNGFQTHKIVFRTGSRPVIVTGVPIDHDRVEAPRALHERIRKGYAELREQSNDFDMSKTIDRLLSALGTYRYHLGPKTSEGRLTSNRMHALRQRRKRLVIKTTTYRTQVAAVTVVNLQTDAISQSDAPWS